MNRHLLFSFLRKFYIQLFVITLLPLIACRQPSEQAAQPIEQSPASVTTTPTAAATVHPTPTFVDGQSIEFETVVIDGCKVEKGEVQLFLITTREEIAIIEDQVNQATQQQLQNIDFNEYIVLALLRGLKPSNNYQTLIEHIVQQEHRLTIYAQFWEPSPYWSSTSAETSPCHLVKVARQDILDLSQVELVLQAIPLTPTPPAN